MGQSVLKIHRAENQQFCPYGFYATLGAEDFQLPFDAEGQLDDFREDFQLRRDRDKRTKTGLSIVIPFPEIDEIEIGKMIQSAIIHYFYPIIAGDLIVTVANEDGEIVIDAGSIDAVVEEHANGDASFDAARLQALFAMVRRTLALDRGTFLTLPEPTPPRAPDWSTGRFDESVIVAIKKQFAETGMLAIRIPLTVRRKNPRRDASTFFDVFVERDEMLAKAEDHYIRQGITISKITTLKEKGYRGIVVVEDDALSSLLGDSENPSHTLWEEKEKKLKERFDWGAFTVRFVRNALPRIVSQLIFMPEGRDFDTLRNIFFLDVDAAEKKDKRRSAVRSKDANESAQEDLDLPESKAPFVVRKIDGGFKVGLATKGAFDAYPITVEVAYEVRRGNAFKKYDKFDFDLGSRPISIESSAATCSAQRNRLEVLPQSREFSVQVSGFDPNRDLAVRVTRTKRNTDNVADI
jgi:hypothetical protein